MLDGTWRKLESMANTWGGGMHSESPGSYWPYIGVDWALSYILRGEPDRALEQQYLRELGAAETAAPTDVPRV